MKPQLVMSWSSGKDSAMALHELKNRGDFEIVALLTTVSEEYKRISHHGVREELLDAQAESIGIPLAKVYLPSQNSHPCTDNIYEEIMGKVMRQFKADGVSAVGFGDLFLEDLRAWREKNLAQLGMNGAFPLWKRDTTALAGQIIDSGFKTYLSCVEGKVGPGFAGRPFDRELLRDLPTGIDPCGEYGEFHTFAHAGPIFKDPIPVKVGQVVVRDGRFYADLFLASHDSEAELHPGNIPPII
jgi:uncharacterized protein (TIGR00290 family)